MNILQLGAICGLTLIWLLLCLLFLVVMIPCWTAGALVVALQEEALMRRLINRQSTGEYQ
ncbi:hypothetical protein [Sphingobium cloacae]|uniref:hypothetical protein n=1 Tax=Sphingobium cloacae TaxID=120107 RepID=UPI0008329900|nr:hypothetical protein [Sphingobium cloacae]